jgi:hypothetical protein
MKPRMPSSSSAAGDCVGAEGLRNLLAVLPDAPATSATSIIATQRRGRDSSRKQRRIGTQCWCAARCDSRRTYVKLLLRAYPRGSIAEVLELAGRVNA